MIFKKVSLVRVLRQYFSRKFSQKTNAIKCEIKDKNDPKLIRNIGILAHIDAGMAKLQQLLA